MIQALYESDTLQEPGRVAPVRSRAESHADHVGLARRIEQLPAVQARLIRMSYFEAKTHSEIAAELGMPLGTVKSSLRRAFLKLQAQMGGGA